MFFFADPHPGLVSGLVPSTEMMHDSVREDLRSEEALYYETAAQHHHSADHTNPSYPLQGQSYTSYPSDEQPYSSETQPHTSVEHQTKIYAPVPMYSLQNVSADAVQNDVYNPDASHTGNLGLRNSVVVSEHTFLRL